MIFLPLYTILYTYDTALKSEGFLEICRTLVFAGPITFKNVSSYESKKASFVLYKYFDLIIPSLTFLWKLLSLFLCSLMVLKLGYGLSTEQKKWNLKT